MASDDTLGKRIRILRMNKGISQRKLADLTGITVQMINKYENGHAIPTAVILARLAEATECEDPGWLLTGKKTHISSESGALCPVWYDKRAQKVLCSICDHLKIIYEADETFGQMLLGIISVVEQLITLRDKVSRQ